MECSAKDNYNVRDIFKCFVTLSRILPPSEEDTPLKRRSSAYVKGGKSSYRSVFCVILFGYRGGVVLCNRFAICLVIKILFIKQVILVQLKIGYMYKVEIESKVNSDV